MFSNKTFQSIKGKIAKVPEIIGTARQALESTIEKYRTWGWLIAISCFIVSHVCIPEAIISWLMVAGMVALYFAMYGDYIFSKELFHTDYFLATTAMIAFVIGYGIIFGITNIVLMFLFSNL